MQNASEGVLACFAVKQEAAAFRKLVADSPNVKVLITGIGMKNAERAFRKAVEISTPALVLTCGFAGALDPKLKVGDVIFLTLDSKLDKALVKLGATPASFLCAPRLAATAAEKEKLWRTTSMCAVEMESLAIHNVCRERGIVSRATVRVISDAADEDLPLDFNQLMTAEQKISIPKLAGAVLKSPGKIPELRRFQKQVEQAAERLAGVLAELLRLRRS
jgi:nucleoside phosphorylase